VLAERLDHVGHRAQHRAARLVREQLLDPAPVVAPVAVHAAMVPEPGRDALVPWGTGMGRGDSSWCESRL